MTMYSEESTPEQAVENIQDLQDAAAQETAPSAFDAAQSAEIALKLNSADFTSAAVTAKVLTGLVAGTATPIAATDTILVALANLQAQIDAL